MKLDCVVTACNKNPLYMGFIPIFIKTWNKLYPFVDVKIVFISDNIPNEYKEYEKNLILFKPLLNISTAFISQYIRLLYPAILDYNNGIMITDMDMLPMNRTYYTKNIYEFSNDKFIYLRNVLLTNKQQIATCYNVAINKIWSEIFGINSIDDINIRLKEVYSGINYADVHGGSGWSTDQVDLYNYVMAWNQKTNNFISLQDNNTGFSRLDRGILTIGNETGLRFTIRGAISLLRSLDRKNKIKRGFFSDYHCCRPHHKYENINNKIYNLL